MWLFTNWLEGVYEWCRADSGCQQCIELFRDFETGLKVKFLHQVVATHTVTFILLEINFPNKTSRAIFSNHKPKHTPLSCCMVKSNKAKVVTSIAFLKSTSPWKAKNTDMLDAIDTCKSNEQLHCQEKFKLSCEILKYFWDIFGITFFLRARWTAAFPK